MTRDQILAGCRMAHAEFEVRTGERLADDQKMLYQAAFFAGALLVIDARDEHKAVLSLVKK